MWIAINNSKSLIVKSWLSQDGGRGTSNWVYQFLKNIKIWTNLAKASIYVFDTYKRVLSISGTILCKLFRSNDKKRYEKSELRFTVFIRVYTPLHSGITPPFCPPGWCPFTPLEFPSTLSPPLNHGEMWLSETCSIKDIPYL